MSVVRRLATAALDLVLPPACPACDARTGAPHQLCPACFAKAGFIAAPACRSCGAPFDSADAAGPHRTCLRCAAAPPPWRGARAALLYDEWSRRLLLPMKYGDRTENARTLARWMHRAGAELLAEAELLVPVPLHRARLRQRRYNQAALLAYAVGRLSARPVCPDALLRTRDTAKLAALAPAARRAALAGAIAPRPSRIGLLSGRRVLLVDDILTTGTTLGHCAEALRGAGAARVDVLVAARTASPDHWDVDDPEADRRSAEPGPGTATRSPLGIAA
ncbi:MAG: ComF family protein [Gluconacetobacter diazotrophicus]|nr:ComF family protein [Gluconacetobacter diazotrophicus]